MIQIRAAQIDRFSGNLRQEADQRLAVYARQRFPEKLANAKEEDLILLASQVRQTAKSYDINREDNVATFLDFTVMYGADFHQAAWAADVLQDQALHGPDRMALLRHKVHLTEVNL